MFDFLRITLKSWNYLSSIDGLYFGKDVVLSNNQRGFLDIDTGYAFNKIIFYSPVSLNAWKSAFQSKYNPIGFPTKSFHSFIKTSIS